MTAIEREKYWQQYRSLRTKVDHYDNLIDYIKDLQKTLNILNNEELCIDEIIISKKNQQDIIRINYCEFNNIRDFLINQTKKQIELKINELKEL